MNLYYLSQTVVSGYDTFSDAVVSAETEEEARFTHPGSPYISGELQYKEKTFWSPEHKAWMTDERLELAKKYPYEDWLWESPRYDWPEPSQVKVTLVGVALEGTPSGVVCASYHQG